MTFADLVGTGWSYFFFVVALVGIGSFIYKDKKGKWPWNR